MAKIKHIQHIDEDGKKWAHDQYLYWCEGCGYEHAFALINEQGHHTFNGDLNNPTVSPSLVQNFGGSTKHCHSFIINGSIQYLGDCEHELAGKTIELPDIDKKYEERKNKKKD